MLTVDELQRYVGEMTRDIPSGPTGGGGVVHGLASAGLLAEAIGMNRRSILRWKKTGIPPMTADKIACTLGEHPCVIWRDWWTYRSELPEREESAVAGPERRHA